VPDRYGASPTALIGSVPGDAGHNIGIALMHRVDDKRYFAPAWEALRRELQELDLLSERYPELTDSNDEPLRSLVEFDFVHNIALGLRDERAISHWTMYTNYAEDFARRLHASERWRERIAEAVGLSLAEFDEKAPEVLRSAQKLGQFPEDDAVALLETGSRR